MSNKLRLQDHNIELSNLIDNANKLPAYENVEPEVDKQENIIAEIMSILPFKGASAAYGNYVYKRYSLPVNTVLSFTQTVSNPATFIVSSNDIDLSTVDANYFVGIPIVSNEISSSALTNITITFKENGVITVNSGSGTYTYDSTTQTITTSWNLSADGIMTWGDYIIEGQYNFIDYVVSDDESTYPDGAEQDGYWYSKASIADTIKIDYGIVTVAQQGLNPLTSITISHSLNAIPTYAIIIPKDGFTAQGSYYTNAVINNQVLYTYTASSTAKAQAVYTSSISKTETDVIFNYNGSNNWMANTYLWIVIA